MAPFLFQKELGKLGAGEKKKREARKKGLPWTSSRNNCL